MGRFVEQAPDLFVFTEARRLHIVDGLGVDGFPIGIFETDDHPHIADPMRREIGHIARDHQVGRHATRPHDGVLGDNDLYVLGRNYPRGRVIIVGLAQGFLPSRLGVLERHLCTSESYTRETDSEPQYRGDGGEFLNRQLLVNLGRRDQKCQRDINQLLALPSELF